MLSKSIIEDAKGTMLEDYKVPSMPVSLRVKDLLSRMTLKEKVAQMMGVWEQRATLILDEKEQINIKANSARGHRN